MKKKIIILVTIFIALVIYLIPAKLIEHFLLPHNQIEAHGFSGRLWSGNISHLAAQNFSFSNVGFSINPVSLFAAKLSVDLDLTKGAIEGGLNLGLTKDFKNSINVSDADLTFNSQLIARYLPMRNVNLKGGVSINDGNITIENNTIKMLSGNFVWRHSVVVFAGQEWSLGDFAVRSSTDEQSKVITFELLKAKNKLDLKGKANLSPNGVIEFIGSISTEIEQPIYNAVALFNNGKPSAGRLPIKFRQKIF